MEMLIAIVLLGVFLYFFISHNLSGIMAKIDDVVKKLEGLNNGGK